MYGKKSVPREFRPECEFSGLTKSGLSSPDCIKLRQLIMEIMCIPQLLLLGQLDVWIQWRKMRKQQRSRAIEYQKIILRNKNTPFAKTLWKVENSKRCFVLESKIWSFLKNVRNIYTGIVVFRRKRNVFSSVFNIFSPTMNKGLLVLKI